MAQAKAGSLDDDDDDPTWRAPHTESMCTQPGLAGRQVRASGGAERHSGSPSARAISVSVRRRSG